MKLRLDLIMKLLAPIEGIISQCPFALDYHGLYVGRVEYNDGREVELCVYYPVRIHALFYEDSISYEDEDIIAVNKPAQVDSYDIQDAIEGAELLHRLDRDTSGVLLLGRNEVFIKKAINEFKNRRVEKHYVAWVEGVVYEAIEIDEPIHTIKKGKAFSMIDPVRGKKAHTLVKPEEVQGKKSKVHIEITTGRTHQIRVHLAHVGHPIVGDEQYGSRTQSKRILLHSAKMKILGHTFIAKEPKDIARYK